MAPKEAKPSLSTLDFLYNRFARWATLPLLGTLGAIIVSSYNETKLSDQTQLIAIAAVNAQLSALVAAIQGDARTQAAVDAGQNWRMEQHELGLADHESRLRVLEMWRTNVINRPSPPL